jgi:predicted alpha-1,2-mannosidase
MKLNWPSRIVHFVGGAAAFGLVGCGPASPTPSSGSVRGPISGTGGAAVGESTDVAGPDEAARRLPDVARFVNPFIGTAAAPNVQNPVGGGKGGSDFPGATVPWGGVQFSPDTPNADPSGYGYEATTITGFSLTHFSGAGCANGGDLPVLAFANPTATQFHFQHANEHAAPGYYDVTSDDGVRVELTATPRTGFARFTFPAGSAATVVFDASRSQTAAKITTNKITAAARNDGLEGYTVAGRFCGGDIFPLYFTVQFDRPWQTSTIKNGKAVLSFDAHAKRVVQMKIGVSYYAQPNAEINLEQENPGWSFDGVRAAARRQWNQRLNAVEVTGDSDDDKTKFYTALYHSLLHPNVYSDVTGDYIGFEKVNHQTDPGRVQYANFSGWDIYRSQVQLASLLFPDVWSDIVQSLVNDAQQCGAFPKWSQNNVEDDVMAGDPGSLIVANAYAFGARNFDTAGALDVMRAMSIDPNAACNGKVELPALGSYLGRGFTEVNWAASDVLEYAARDAAVAQYAATLGDDALARMTAARSGYWRNQLNPTAVPRSIQPRNGDGSWPTPIPPAGGFNNGFTEASAEQYGWYVPQDLRGLFDAYGGNAAVVSRLDNFFTQINAGGTSAYCYIGNEPDFTTPFLYDWAGAPWRTQDVVHRALSEVFSTAPGGMAGNDDLGAMSSLLTWFMMGLYPELPGVGGVAIASPSFTSVTVHLPHGKSLLIRTSGSGRYVQSARLNGVATTSLWLPVSTILAGATLDFALGDSPSTWGSAPGDAPPSFGLGTVAGLSDAFNSRGITSDSAPDAANCDGWGWSYSAEALAAAGASGSSVTVNNVVFPWPAAGALDNFVPGGQTITLAGAHAGGRLALLGAVTAGPATGSATLSYSDGSSATATIGFSDWTLNGGKAQVMDGTQIAFVTKYRNYIAGQQDPTQTYIFYTEVPLDPAKTIASVTLPPTVSAGRMHIFSLALAP